VGSNLWTFDFFFVKGNYPASLRNVGSSFQVPIRAWNNTQRGNWGLPSSVKLKSRLMIYTVLVLCKMQPKQISEWQWHCSILQLAKLPTPLVIIICITHNVIENDWVLKERSKWQKKWKCCMLALIEPVLR
jgi:hypothetical protein